MTREDRRKFNSVKRKKRRGFFGRRPQEVASTSDDGVMVIDESPCSSSSVNVAGNVGSPDSQKNVSFQKLLNSFFDELESSKGVLTRKNAREVGLGSTAEVEIATGFKVQDASLLSECISDAAICSSCRKPASKLQLFQRNTERDGLCESLFLKCSSCQVETPLMTSKRLGGKGGGAHEVNRRSVLSSHQMGHAGLSQFCAGMNIPPPVTKKAYNQHLIQIEKAATSHTDKIMKEAAERLREKVQVERPDDVDTNGVAEVAVTVDGTWQKRGHSSKIGVIFVISVDTGEILDYSVKSLLCHECKIHEANDKDTAEYKKWKKEHQSKCEINHHGSSEAMEADAAVEIFSRSITSRNLKYTTFVGDGDSSSYGRVKEALDKKFGSDYEIQKEECVGHVQKRLGSALRRYKNEMKGKKLSDGKAVGGKGRLTDKVIDQMQNYYGKAIRENPGNLDGMKESIKAIQNHMISNNKLSLDEQHQHCPKSKDTWCKFQRDKQEKTSTYNKDNRLPDVFMEELEPIFTRLSKDDLLNRCLKGMTQNQNESANGMLWARCPKTRFCGARRVRIAVCETVAVFNTGAASKAVIMDLCGITPGANTMKALRVQDSVRVKTAAKKVTSKYREQRRKLRAQRKDKSDKNAYQPGGFSLSSKPDNSKGQKKRKRADKNRANNEPPITFVKPTFEVIGVSSKRRRK